MRLFSPARIVLVAVLACWATAADAQWTRHHGSECLPWSIVPAPEYAVTSGGVTNTSLDHPAWFMCASDDTNEHPDSAVKEVKVYVYDASPTESVGVEVCILRREIIYWDCSLVDATSPAFVGGTYIRLSATDLDWWKHDIDFGILKVILPPRVGLTGFSYVKGWVTEQ